MNAKILLLLSVVIAIFFGLISLLNHDLTNLKLRHDGERALIAPIVAYTDSQRDNHETLSSTVQFKTTRGITVKQMTNFPEEIWDDIRLSRTIVVCYDPNSPSNFVFEKETLTLWPWLVLLAIFHGVVLMLKNCLIEAKRLNAEQGFKNTLPPLNRK